MSILRWHTSTAPILKSGSTTAKEPSAFQVLDDYVGDQRPFYQIVSAYPGPSGRDIWLSLFPSLVQLITRMRWPGASTALERIHLKQEHDAVYGGRQEGVGSIDSSAYWHLAKLMTAGDVKDVIQLALNKNRSWVRRELTPPPASLEAGELIQSTLDSQYYTTWYKGPPSPMVYSCCGQQISPHTKGCWISLDPQNQSDEVVVPYTLMPASTAEIMWARLADDDGVAQMLASFLKTQATTLIKGTAFLDYNKFVALDREIQTAWFDQVLPLLAMAIRIYIQAMDASLQQDPPAPFPMNASQVLKVGDNAVALMDLWPVLKHVVGLVYQFNEPQHKDGCKQVMPMLESEWNALFNTTILHVDIAKRYFTVEKRGFIRFVYNGQELRITPLRSWSNNGLERLASQLSAFKVASILQYAELWNELNAERLQMSLVQVSNAEFTKQFSALASEAEITMRVNTALRAGQAQIDMRADNKAAVALQTFYRSNLAARVSVAKLVVQAKGKPINVQSNRQLNELRMRLEQLEAQLASITIPSEQETGLLKVKGPIVQELQQLQQAEARIVGEFAPYILIKQTNKTLNKQEDALVVEQLNLFETELQTLLTRAGRVNDQVKRLNTIYQARLVEIENAKVLEIEKQKQLAAERQRQVDEIERQRLVEIQRRKDEAVSLAEARRLQLEESERLILDRASRSVTLAQFNNSGIISALNIEFGKKRGNLDKKLVAIATEKLFISGQYERFVESETSESVQNLWIGSVDFAQLQVAYILLYQLLVLNQDTMSGIFEIASNISIPPQLYKNVGVGYAHNVPSLNSAIMIPKRPNPLVSLQNFFWEGQDIGGTCPFDSMFTAMFKIPGLWLQKQINRATIVYTQSEKCTNNDAELIHGYIGDDITYIQGNGDRRACLSSRIWDTCVGFGTSVGPKSGDDSRLVLNHLLQFYNLDRFASGSADLRKAMNKSSIVWKPEYDQSDLQLLLFLIGDISQKDVNQGNFIFNVPLTLGPSDKFTLISSVSYRGKGNSGGHWISHVYDPRTKQWWQFDAKSRKTKNALPTNVTQPGNPVPYNVRRGEEDYEQPMAWYYVRTDSLPDFAKEKPLELVQILGRERLYKQAAEQDLYDLQQIEKNVSAKQYKEGQDVILSSFNSLPNWWEIYDSEFETLDTVNKDNQLLYALHLERLQPKYILIAPTQFLLELDVSMYEHLCKVLGIPFLGLDNKQAMQIKIRDLKQQFGFTNASIMETIEHRAEYLNADDKTYNVSMLNRNLFLPLTVMLKEHWPLISTNTVWKPIFEKLKLVPESKELPFTEEWSHERKTEHLHALSNVSKVLFHMNNQEAVPVDLYRLCNSAAEI